jgi:fumarate hydratase class II
MMPIIAHNLNEMMHVMIGAMTAFTDRCVVGLTANREKAHGWLAKNAILVTALNREIGYLNGAAVAKESMATGKTIKEVVVEKGLLSGERVDELLDVHAMTKGGIMGFGGGGGQI